MSMPLNESPEETRKRLISHEASVRSIGSLYYLSAACCAVWAVVGMFAPVEHSENKLVVTTLSVVMSVILVLVGRKFRALDKSAKIPGTLLSILGLLGFPLGTLINLYILYLIHSKKSAEVFSEEYKAVIAATPHIKYKLSIIVLIGVAVIVLLLAAMVLATAKKV